MSSATSKSLEYSQVVVALIEMVSDTVEMMPSYKE